MGMATARPTNNDWANTMTWTNLEAATTWQNVCFACHRFGYRTAVAVDFDRRNVVAC
jgi:hypothetical protein